MAPIVGAFDLDRTDILRLLRELFVNEGITIDDSARLRLHGFGIMMGVLVTGNPHKHRTKS